MRSSSVRCSDTAEGSCAPSGRVVLMAIRVFCPFVVRGPGGIAAHGPGCRAAAGVSEPADAPCTRRTLSAGPAAGPRHLRWPWMGERVWTARLRWRLRGATMWPAFLVALVVDTVLLRALPIAGDQAPDVFAAALLGGFFNLLAVAVGAPLLGRFVRRRRPSLPKVIADDRAGTGLIGAVAAALLAIGIVHHPVLEARARDFDVQAAAARQFVLGRAPHRFAANVDRMDTMKQGPGLYRSCVPGPTRRRSFCVFVDTRMHPPAVIGDHDQSPNSVLAGPDNPGRIAR